MSETSQNNSDNQEIDLSQVTKKIGHLFGNILTTIFRGFLFFKRNIILVGILFLIGASLGFYLDKTSKSYTSQIIVSPSGGVDYLYSKIELVKSNLSEKDSAFFKNIGISNAKKIKSIEIKPIIDLYNFVNINTTTASNAQNTQNFEVIKLLAESKDINEVIKDETTSKNYPYHLITISTNGKIAPEEIIKPFLKYLNTDDYLNQISKITKENILTKTKKNEEQIIQIDSIIHAISNNIGQNNKNNNLIYNNENNQINDLFDLKNNLINEIAYQKIQLVKIETFIKDISIIPNIRNTNSINGKMKLILPMFFIGLFVLIRVIRSFYLYQMAKLNS